MAGNNPRWILIICFLLTNCSPSSSANPTATLPIDDWTSSPPSTVEPATGPPTSPSVFQAVAKENLNCFFGYNEGYDASVNLPQFQIVMAVGKDTTGNWILVRLNEFADCWVQISSLDLQGDIYSLPVITVSLPPIITPTALVAQIVNPSELDPMELRWKIVSYECNNNGGVTNVTIDLDISGGLPPYTTSLRIPINTTPGQDLSIKVSSNTHDGEPSDTINFTVPRSADFKCRGTGNNPGPPSPSTSSSIPTPILPGDPPTPCWPPGHCK